MNPNPDPEESPADEDFFTASRPEPARERLIRHFPLPPPEASDEGPHQEYEDPEPVPEDPQPQAPVGEPPPPAPARSAVPPAPARTEAPAIPPRTGTGSPREGREPRGPNQRRSSHLMKLFVLLVFTNAAFFATCAFFFMRKTAADFEGRLARAAEGGGKPAKPAADPELAARLEAIEKQNKVLQLELETAIKRTVLSAEQAGQASGLASQLESRLEELRKSRSGPSTPESGSGSGQASPSDLVLLKERNRLTAYADEAIATGARGPYERLWDTFDDPRLANLVHAARAEILRVQDCYINGQRVKFYGVQQHQIPIAEIFPDSTSLTQAQLSDDQLIQVLHDLKQSWQTRVKAAWLLGQRRSTKVGDALVKAIKDDPALDVVAEATFSFEQITGYHAKLFEVAPLEAWWKTYNEKAPAQKVIPKAKAGPAKTPAPAKKG